MKLFRATFNRTDGDCNRGVDDGDDEVDDDDDGDKDGDEEVMLFRATFNRTNGDDNHNCQPLQHHILKSTCVNYLSQNVIKYFILVYSIYTEYRRCSI